jgi:hypothetical protein
MLLSCCSYNHINVSSTCRWQRHHMNRTAVDTCTAPVLPGMQLKAKQLLLLSAGVRMSPAAIPTRTLKLRGLPLLAVARCRLSLSSTACA